MASTFTPNVQFEEPARGDQVGTWDTPVNGNMTLADLVMGGITTIALNNSPVVLAAAQFQCKQITFNSTLTGSVAITFPSSFKKSYEIQHLCTGSSAFVITMQTTAAGGQVICVPPGETVDCFNDGANIKFKNLDRVGTYWDYAGSSVPAWVSGCTVPPYLACTGGTFSAVTYPQLAIILGSTTLPDSRGRFRAALNGGTSRLTSSFTGGVNGDIAYSAGGTQTSALALGNLPPYSPAGTINNVVSGGTKGGTGAITNYQVGGAVSGVIGPADIIVTSSFTGSPQGGANDAFSNIPPTFIGGVTMIRAG